MADDTVDLLISQWRKERPELDPAAMAVVGRVLRLAGRLERRLERKLAPFDLTPWQFDVLATLRRSGEPFRLSPSRLLEAVMLSSGAMTNRIDRLEAKGLVARFDDPEDGRGVLIALTVKGRRLVDRAIVARFEEARANVATLDAAAFRAMEAGLRSMLESAEDGAEPG